MKVFLEDLGLSGHLSYFHYLGFVMFRVPHRVVTMKGKSAFVAVARWDARNRRQE